MSAEGLVFCDVFKRFGDQEVLAGVSFSVPFGTVYALLGSNGAGKSTLMNISLGHIPADAGFVMVGGVRVDERPLESKRRLAYAPEIARFYGELSAVENLQLFEELMGRRRPTAVCVQILQRMGLEQEAALRKVSTFSKGMRQRLSLALGLLKGADVFLLDEPTSGLDPESARRLIGVMRSLAATGKAVCFSSHDVQSVLLAADRIAVLDGGRIASDERVEDYRARRPDLLRALS